MQPTDDRIRISNPRSNGRGRPPALRETAGCRQARKHFLQAERQRVSGHAPRRLQITPDKRQELELLCKIKKENINFSGLCFFI